MNMERQNKESKICTVIVWVAAILRVFLQSGLPIRFIEASPSDDMLMVNYANSILNGAWLGKYTSSTLNKVPGFPLFLALITRCNIPYMMGVGIGYTFACLLFFKVICHFTAKWAATLFYLYLLYSPAILSFQVAQRVYRCSIIPILVLSVLSCCLMIWHERNGEIKKLLPWCILEGVSFAWFYLTREDSVWLYPFVLGAAALTTIKLIWDNKRTTPVKCYAKKICIMAMPVLMCIAATNVLKLKNYMEYGVYVITDFKDTGYADMGKNILKIKSDEEIDQVWVSHSTIEKLYEVSPTFSTLKPSLEAMYDSLDDWVVADNDEIEKDYSIWAIRWAADANGVYSDATTADSFFSKINQEIEQAFESGELEKNDKIVLSNLARPFQVHEIPTILECAGTYFWKNVSYGRL